MVVIFCDWETHSNPHTTHMVCCIKLWKQKIGLMMNNMNYVVRIIQSYIHGKGRTFIDQFKENKTTKQWNTRNCSQNRAKTICTKTAFKPAIHNFWTQWLLADRTANNYHLYCFNISCFCNQVSPQISPSWLSAPANYHVSHFTMVT